MSNIPLSLNSSTPSMFENVDLFKGNNNNSLTSSLNNNATQSSFNPNSSVTSFKNITFNNTSSGFRPGTNPNQTYNLNRNKSMAVSQKFEPLKNSVTSLTTSQSAIQGLKSLINGRVNYNDDSNLNYKQNIQINEKNDMEKSMKIREKSMNFSSKVVTKIGYYRHYNLLFH